MKLDNIIILGPGQEIPVGRIAVANENRSDTATLIEPLTAYAAGYKDPENLDDMLEFLAPGVRVARRFEYPVNGSYDNLFAENENGDVRSIGADFKVIKTSGTLVQAKTANKGLTEAIDLDEIEDDVEGAKQRKVARLKRILIRTELIRAIALHVIAAGSASQKSWATSSTNTDADSDVLSAIDTVRTSANGGFCNRVVYTDSAWTRRILGLRLLNTAGGYASSGMTPEQLAAFLGVQGIKRCESVYYNKAAETKRSGVGKASTSGYLGRVLGFYGQSGVDKEDPSTLKRFLSGTVDGSDFRVWEQMVNSKVLHLTVEHNSLLASTMGGSNFSLEVK
jgi:hypothetical protein